MHKTHRTTLPGRFVCFVHTSLGMALRFLTESLGQVGKDAVHVRANLDIFCCAAWDRGVNLCTYPPSNAQGYRACVRGLEPGGMAPRPSDSSRCTSCRAPRCSFGAVHEKAPSHGKDLRNTSGRPRMMQAILFCAVRYYWIWTELCLIITWS